MHGYVGSRGGCVAAVMHSREYFLYKACDYCNLECGSCIHRLVQLCMGAYSAVSVHNIQLISINMLLQLTLNRIESVTTITALAGATSTE